MAVCEAGWLVWVGCVCEAGKEEEVGGGGGASAPLEERLQAPATTATAGC